ncbi:hypothetical protein M409DRAFT_16894 [Zasmidium cellare ATCC 36951]|uniref:DUF1763-domain-containing protein n=1 Tax=Zasmidium cellare ATCC 36951 TaxID=1080233 RepID=A0A6A6D1K8_ZASCE|nr:uncharacterized protein M409DRAFT_16894 [Zasmidium cellare ATCC 36951]KAF2172943.1 hypothetical protein M409DRAFT_16894 [Zasmidium cellare ATCC 36951]
MTVTNHEVVTAYRHLYQHLLRAVRYAKPARFVCRDKIRDAFRKPSSHGYDPERIANTLHFLECASKTTGLEHKILKNFVFVTWERRRLGTRVVRNSDRELRRRAYAQYDETLEKFNESMGLCIK